MRLLANLYSLELEWAAHGSCPPPSGDAGEHMRLGWAIVHKARTASHGINQDQVEVWMADRERSLAAFSAKVTSQPARGA